MNASREMGDAVEEECQKRVKLACLRFYGQKAGMTRIFDESGKHVPVTVIKLVPNVISQVKTQDKDGYEAYQVAYFEKREKLINKPTKVT
jgi:large subunit ribosomal protein L3